MLENNTYILYNHSCKFELYDDKISSIDFKGKANSFKAYEKLEINLKFSILEGNFRYHVALDKNDQKYYGENNRFGEKLANGIWIANIVKENVNTKSKRCFTGECLLYNDKILQLTTGKDTITFDPPEKVSIGIVVKSKQANWMYIISEFNRNDNFYLEEINEGQTNFSENTKCPSCGKEKENSYSEYCNSCGSKIKNTCPKCGKQEADAAIYWCAKCRDLKCPRCGINVRSSIFDKYCSDCDMELR